MLPQDTHTTDLAVVDLALIDTLLMSIERGDMEQVRKCFRPDALTWHNNDGVEQDVDTMIAVLEGLCAVSTRRTYEGRRTTTVGSRAFLQHTLVADLHSGGQLRLTAMMRIDVDTDGLVARIEEYFDSRDLDCLADAG